MALALTQRQKDAKTAKILAGLGIKMPMQMILAARKTKTPLPVAGALLMMETGGGRNVYGHDPVANRAPKGGAVTRENYRDVYLPDRKAGKGMQGVGPTQLTWYGFQDQADKMGGAWNPQINMEVGFALVKSKIARYGIAPGFAAYNGSGPAAKAYGARAAAQHARFAVALKAKPPAPPRIAAPGWRRYVYGDTDCNADLLNRLALVARDRGKGFKVFVRYGKRTYAEQAVLYQAYLKNGHPLTAKPGTSRHETGRAADCQLVFPNGHQVNIGADATARALLAKYRLILPVPGESWHVERKV